jgi:hypothetical protein
MQTPLVAGAVVTDDAKKSQEGAWGIVEELKLAAGTFVACEDCVLAAGLEAPTTTAGVAVALAA